MKIYLWIAAAVALAGLGLQINAWRNGADDAARLRTELADQAVRYEKAIRDQHDATEADRVAAIETAAELEKVRDAYDEIRRLPPVILTREVPRDQNSPSCPPGALSDAFGVRFDIAARNPTP